MQQPVALVLLPGLDGTGLLFKPLLEILPPRFRPIVVAYPDDQPLGYAELLPRALELIPKEGPYLILGESFGGPLALMAAENAKGNLLGVVLSASFVKNPVRFLPAWMAFLSLPGLFRLVPFLQGLKSFLYRDIDERVLRLAKLSMARVHPRVLAKRCKEILSLDASAELRRCPVPILYLEGARDFVVPRHNIALIESLNPKVKKALIPSSHLLLQTHPKEGLAAIEDFVAHFTLDRPGKLY